jgi:hypothetical protein
MWPAVVASCNVVAVCVCSKVEAVVTSLSNTAFFLLISLLKKNY